MNEFFPCILIEHPTSFSIICSDFHYFDDYFGDKDGGGYAVERLARKRAKESNITKEITWDSEAGMFSASSSNKEALLTLAKQLQQITGEEALHTPQAQTKPTIPLEEAEKLVLQGFVLALDKEKQAQFYKQVPFPALTPKQKEYVDALVQGTAEEKISAAKKINAEARTKTRRWDHYLSHPQLITYFLDAIDIETNSKVIQELIWALVFICNRHLPDLRTQTYFIRALASKNATLRWLGIMGLDNLYPSPEAYIVPMTQDKSKKVSEKATEVIQKKRTETRVFPSWMFDEKNVVK